MDASEAHKYRQIYIKTFIPLAASFSVICLIGVFWDYASFIDSRKHLNERAINELQKLVQVRISNIKEEVNIVETRINHSNSINKIIQALGTPVFNSSKSSRIYPFISSHFILKREKLLFLTPYGISDFTDFPEEILKKLPKISTQGEFYLWDDTLYYMRRIKHASLQEFDGVLILFCEAREIVDSEYKSGDINILLSQNTYAFSQTDKLERAYGLLHNPINISGNSYDYYAILPEKSLILLARLTEVDVHKIYLKQRTTLWGAIFLLFMLIASFHLMFKFVFLKRILKLKHKTNIEEQYEQSIKEREKILKEVFLRQQNDIRILIDSYCLTSSHIEGSLRSDILTPQRLEELNLTVAKSSDALEDGILSPSSFEDTDVSEVLHKSILFLFHEIYSKEIKISFQQEIPGIIHHDPLIIKLLFINILNILTCLNNFKF